MGLGLGEGWLLGRGGVRVGVRSHLVSANLPNPKPKPNQRREGEECVELVEEPRRRTGRSHSGKPVRDPSATREEAQAMRRRHAAEACCSGSKPPWARWPA